MRIRDDKLPKRSLKVFNSKGEVEGVYTHMRDVLDDFGPCSEKPLGVSGMTTIGQASVTLSKQAQAQAAPNRKIEMRLTKELYDDAIKVLAVANPALVQGIYRHRVHVSWQHFAPRDWLAANCKGFYHINESDMPRVDGYHIGFELEDDLMLFKMTFEGQEGDG